MNKFLGGGEYVLWLKSNGLWLGLNSFAALILVFTLSQGRIECCNQDTFHPGLESGKWAIRFLIACLTMTPLRNFFGWKHGIKLRKSTGLWSFGFAAVHVLTYVFEMWQSRLDIHLPFFIMLGLVGMAALSVLALTSNHWAMRRLRKNWKRLHRLVYLAGGTIVIHAVLAASASKKMHLRDPEAIFELRVYLAVLIMLLVIRIPAVRRMLRRARQREQQPQYPHLAISLLDANDRAMDVRKMESIGHSQMHYENIPRIEPEIENRHDQLEAVID